MSAVTVCVADGERRQAREPLGEIGAPVAYGSPRGHVADEGDLRLPGHGRLQPGLEVGDGGTAVEGKAGPDQVTGVIGESDRTGAVARVHLCLREAFFLAELRG